MDQEVRAPLDRGQEFRQRRARVGRQGERSRFGAVVWATEKKGDVEEKEGGDAWFFVSLFSSMTLVVSLDIFLSLPVGVGGVGWNVTEAFHNISKPSCISLRSCDRQQTGRDSP